MTKFGTIFTIKIVRVLSYFKSLSFKVGGVMVGTSKDFRLIKAYKVFRIERLLCNEIFRETIMTSVSNVLFEAGLIGSVSVIDI